MIPLWQESTFFNTVDLALGNNSFFYNNNKRLPSSISEKNICLNLAPLQNPIILVVFLCYTEYFFYS